jgi:hypothetical protein
MLYNSHLARLVGCGTLIAFLLSAGCSGQSDEARYLKRIDWIGEGQWVKADTHIHTSFSDGRYSLEKVLSEAQAYGCDVVAITDHADRRGGDPEYLEAIRVARTQFPDMVVLAGLEWNVPPWGGDGHATVLMHPAVEQGLTVFKQEFDDHGREEHIAERCDNGLLWLAQHCTVDDLPPVVLLNHPTRKSATSIENVRHMMRWCRINSVMVGMSGAPGHQASKTLGNYNYKVAPLDRWDPGTATIGDMWDTVLSAGIDVWAARAPSDYHNEEWDYWPGQFSETWLYVPTRDAAGVLQAFHAGCFFATHGQIVREVQLSVDAHGLDRPAVAGETIVAAAGMEIVVKLEMSVCERDWKGALNQIDEVELIGIEPGGAVRSLLKQTPGESVALHCQLEVPEQGIILRARGRRKEDGPDLMFYTNPIRIVVE